MDFFLGIDGGGTRTRAFAVTADGACGGWGEAGLSNPNHASPELLRANLAAAIEGALRSTGSSIKNCAAVFAGVAGITTKAGRARTRQLIEACGLQHAQVGVDHDIRIALAGGLGGRPGIALIVGTGSSCYARAADGRTWQAGGWEALISDEGSGYFIGVEAMAAAARMADGRTPESPLRQEVFNWLGIQHIAEILPRIHDRGLARAEIAAFAPKVIEHAAKGDAAALDILDRGAKLLGEMVEACYRMLPMSHTPEVVVTGGLGTARNLYRVKIFGGIQHALPSADVRDPMLPPAIGAALLAMQLRRTGVSPLAERDEASRVTDVSSMPPELLERLKRFA